MAVAGDGVRGDDAPAAGRRQHDDVGAGRQGLGGEGRGGLEGLLDRGGPGGAGLPADAVEEPVVAGQRAGVARRGPLPALGGAALDEHDRLLGRRRGQRAGGSHGRRRCPRRRPGTPRWPGLGVEAEVVGDADRGRVAGRDRPADADPGLQGVVHERRHEVPALAGDRDAARPAGTGRRSARRGAPGSTPAPARWDRPAARRARRPAPPARPAPGGPPRRPRRSRPRSRTRRGSPWPRAARSRSAFVEAGVHTNTRSAWPSGSSSIDATVCTPSTSWPSRLVPKTRPS